MEPYRGSGDYVRYETVALGRKEQRSGKATRPLPSTYLLLSKPRGIYSQRTLPGRNKHANYSKCKEDPA